MLYGRQFDTIKFIESLSKAEMGGLLDEDWYSKRDIK